MKSDVATLTVKKAVPPTIAQQPKDVKAKSGAKAKFTVKTKEKDVSFQWFVKAPGANDWEALKGGAKNTLTVTASGANNGAQYRCLVKNKQGGEVFTNAVKLTVTPQPPKFSTQPKDVKVKVGAKAKFKAKASGKNVTYQWYYRENETAEWKALPGATKASYEIKKVAAENIGWQFKCLAKNADGEVWSKVATLLEK